MQLPNISGHFVYRSLLNNTSLNEDFSNLRLGAGIMNFVQNEQGGITGNFDMGGGVVMNLEGSVYADGKTFYLRLTAKGIANTATNGWIYDYLGTITPEWPKAVKQLQTITGSVIRTVDHGNSKAGLTASFYMVRKDK
jgi:hypothetical protein